MTYRPDIDGLRAVAVLAVVLFHAGWGAPGGYVGVDLFFVISGFLITQQIVADVDQNRFSLRHFWERRIRRIWPASLVMTTAVLLAGGFLMLPSDYATLAVDAGAATAMLANVRYWLRGADHYFEAAADVRPLLHMWSLGIEEQFYLFWPLVFPLLWRCGRPISVAFVAGIGLASFVASQMWIGNQPEAVFYLLPFRAWELLLGVLLAISPIPMPRQRGLLNAVAAVGLLMIVLPCGLYSRTTLFPAAAALPPCLGAALLIGSGARAGANVSPVSRLLAVPLLVWVGRISYSLYLWHWPVLAFLRYVLGHDLPPAVTAAALILSVALAAISWSWIEQPFRQPAATGSGHGPSATRIVVVGIIACCAVIGTAAAIHLSDGWPSRFPPSLISFAKTATWNPRFRLPNRPAANGAWRFPVLGQRERAGGNCFLLWGDSHGVAISGLVDEKARKLGISGAAALRPGTLPLPGVWDPNYRGTGGASGPQAVAAWNQTVLVWIHDHKPRHVILCGRWYKPNRPLVPIEETLETTISSDNLLLAGLETVRDACSEAGATLWVLRQIPQQPYPWRRRIIEAHLFRRSIDLHGIDRADHDKDLERVDNVFARLAGDRVRVVDLAEPFFCEDGSSRVGLENESWYYDGIHISPAGATRVLGGLIETILEEVQRDCAPIR